jgi:hypothetical protein
MSSGLCGPFSCYLSPQLSNRISLTQLNLNWPALFCFIWFDDLKLTSCLWVHGLLISTQDNPFSSLPVLSCDVDINTSDTSTPRHNKIFGSITQACARQLNNQVPSFLASYSSYIGNRNVCSVLLLRNDGQEGNEFAFASVTFGFQNSSSLQILSGNLVETTFICIKP